MDPNPSGGAVAGELEVTLVHADACHLCEDAEAAIADLGARVPLRLSRVDAASETGRRLLMANRAGMLPLVLINGSAFSTGRIPRGRLRQLEAEHRTTTRAG